MAVQVKTGLSDGVNTEVIAGLKGNEQVITAQRGGNAQANTAAANPFGGAQPSRF